MFYFNFDPLWRLLIRTKRHILHTKGMDPQSSCSSLHHTAHLLVGFIGVFCLQLKALENSYELDNVPITLMMRTNK